MEAVFDRTTTGCFNFSSGSTSWIEWLFEVVLSHGIHRLVFTNKIDETFESERWTPSVSRDRFPIFPLKEMLCIMIKHSVANIPIVCYV